MKKVRPNPSGSKKGKRKSTKKSKELKTPPSFSKIRYSERTENQIRLTPSFRFFGARIRHHPENLPSQTPHFRKDDNPPRGRKDSKDNLDEEEDSELSEKFVESTEIIFKRGRVAGIAVDKDFLAVVNESKGHHQFCLCCSDKVFDIAPELRYNTKAQAGLLVRILLIENFLHLVTLGSLAAQYYTPFIHDFVYEQWAVITLLITINHITLIWSVMFSELAAHHPADNVLLVVKALTHSCVGMCTTALFERMIVKWVISRQDFPDAGALISLYRARKHWPYTYPIIVSAFLVNLSLVNVVISVFLYCFRGNVKKDAMFWVALASQGALSGGLFVIYYFQRNMGFKVFHGPPEWDYLQLVMSGFAALVWEEWRIYNLRLIMMGRKYDVNQKAYKRGALHFCI